MDPQVAELFKKWERALALQQSRMFKEASDTLMEMAEDCERAAFGNQTKFFLDWESRALREAAGMLLFSLGQPEKALPLYLQAQDVSKRAGDIAVESACLNNVGDCLTELGRDEDALDCYNRSFSLLERLPYGRGHAISLYNAAYTCQRLGKTEEGLRYAFMGLKLVRNAGDSSRISEFEKILRDLGASATAFNDVGTEGTNDIPAQAKRVLALEQRFAETHRTQATALCSRARWASNMAQSGLSERDLQRVRSVPVTSFPMGSINACVCRLLSGGYYINLSPELLIAFWETCRLTGDVARGSLDSDKFVQTLRTFTTRLARGIHVFDGAERLAEHFHGVLGWQLGTAWVVLHEYGHFLLGHLSKAPVKDFHALGHAEASLSVCQTDSLKMEKEADTFATEACLTAFSSLGEDAGACLAFTTGSLMTILGATAAISRGIEDKAMGDASTSSHPSVFERVDAVVDFVSRRFPKRTSDIERAAAPWRALCCSPDSMQEWWKMGRLLGKEHFNIVSSTLSGTI